MDRSIFILGGDLRLYYSALYFEKCGFNVFTHALYGDAGECVSLYEGMKKSDIILLPTPSSSDGENLFAPSYEGKISLSEIATLAGDEKIIFGGRVPEGIFSSKVCDILKRDDFAILNAVPTAEGALEIAMRESIFTISKSRVLIAGFGRIGKISAKLFSAMGASVTVSARKSSDIAMISAMGYKATETCMIGESLSEYDIIINTVPFKIIENDALSRIKKDAVIIDTASLPGGLDIPLANKMGIKAFQALSLPGKVAPKTSGEIICDTVLSILEKREF